MPECCANGMLVIPDVLIEVPGKPTFSFPIRPRGPAEPKELGFEPCGLTSSNGKLVPPGSA